MKVKMSARHGNANFKQKNQILTADHFYAKIRFAFHRQAECARPRAPSLEPAGFDGGIFLS